MSGYDGTAWVYDPSNSPRPAGTISHDKTYRVRYYTQLQSPLQIGVQVSADGNTQRTATGGDVHVDASARYERIVDVVDQSTGLPIAGWMVCSASGTSY